MITRATTTQTEIKIPSVFGDFSYPYRYRIWYGGRGSGKSWTVARILVAMAATRKIRILCCREYQNSMSDSVQKLLTDQIALLGLESWFRITQSSIFSSLGSEFIFKGLGRNSQAIKSIEKIDIAWVEEAQTISQHSLDILLPTIRAEGSEIWLTYNPQMEHDPVHQLKNALEDAPNALVRKVGWQDNPWFPKVLNEERLRLLASNPSSYNHIWEGECLVLHEAIIFKDCFSIKTFEAPEQTHFYYGVDWGFARDPTIMIRCFIHDHCLYIDFEAGGVGIELDDLPALFAQIPQSRQWPIRADSARPETISYLRKKYGFRLIPARKKAGSIEDGISKIRSFSHIYIHPRCQRCLKEFTLYAYKTDRLSGDVLPFIEDAHNHTIDALRYALEPLIHPQANLPDFSAYHRS